MRPTNFFSRDLLELETMEHPVVRLASPVTAVRSDGPDLLLELALAPIPLMVHEELGFAGEEIRPVRLRLRAYGDAIVRLTLERTPGAPLPDSEMLDFDPALQVEPLHCEETTATWRFLDSQGRERGRIDRIEPVFPKDANAESRAFVPRLNLTLAPDGKVPVAFASYDQFYGRHWDSMVLAEISASDQVREMTFALVTEPGESFYGTGERFHAFDLRGQTLELTNVDALGCNSRRAYKNIPFCLSSRAYGVFLHSSAEITLSPGGESTRSLSAVVREPGFDLFLIGGGTPERVLYGYRQLTGFPPELPAWSYGVWMSRMSYFSAAEVDQVADRLRAGDFPCDVLHLDTGYFATDWVCEWNFSPERFPDPAGFVAGLRRRGFRLSLWQTPYLKARSCRYPEGVRRGALTRPRPGAASCSINSDFSTQEEVRHLDFSSPEGCRYYGELLHDLLKTGAAVIKTDFGEEQVDGEYNLPLELLHNRYALLYQQCAYEIVKRETGEGILWARSAWAGCQRYPVHWGGDAECSFAAMASSLRGGLQLGLSGFAYWSCDVPGFHGRREFMHDHPTPELYLRWTQMAILLSHLRYHGSSPREPYAFPTVADQVRALWKLRYVLLPYLQQTAQRSIRSGLPVARALLLGWPDDPECRAIDDQFLCGDDLLVAPILTPDNRRDLYLPAGDWVDVWSGEVLPGGRWLRRRDFPLDRFGLFARRNAVLPVYPDPVAHTGEMRPERVTELRFDATYRGLAAADLPALRGQF